MYGGYRAPARRLRCVGALQRRGAGGRGRAARGRGALRRGRGRRRPRRAEVAEGTGQRPRPGRLVRRAARGRDAEGGDRSRPRRANRGGQDAARRGGEDGHDGRRRRRLGTARGDDRPPGRERRELTMEIRFHGHSCFELSEGGTTVLVDPFLAPNNPSAVASAEDVEPTHTALSHGHADHVADAVSVATRTGAHCVAMVELANWLEGQGVEKVSDPNLGGTVEFDWGYIGLVPAWHTNTTPGSEEKPFSAEHGVVMGPAAGLVIKIGETTVYHAGDTCLFSDMKLIADRRDAVVAADFVGAATVIPMHYDTFPAIETDAEAFKSEVEEKTSSRVVLLKAGETHSA